MCRPDWPIILEFSKLLVGWPLLALVGGMLLVKRYDRELRALIGRVTRLPGGIAADQQPPDPIADEPAPVTTEAPSNDPALAEAQGLAVYWEFRTINFQLAPITQGLVDWLGRYGPMPITDFEVYPPLAGPTLGDARQATVDILLNHGLIFIPEGRIQLSAKGVGYLQWPGRRVLGVNPEAFLPQLTHMPGPQVTWPRT